jgi:hypothetical protein
MNERIKELIEQSGFEEKDGHISIQGVYMFNTYRMEKFAQLIVRECIQVVDGMADPEEDSDRYVWALHNAIEKIREHFGVQE